MNIFDENNKTKYTIIDTLTNEIKFHSDSKPVQLFDVNNRINHFYKRDSKYYLIRIAFADLSSKDNKYIGIIYLRLNPILHIDTSDL